MGPDGKVALHEFYMDRQEADEHLKNVVQELFPEPNVEKIVI